MAKLKDTHTPPRLGLKTSAQFYAGSEMAPDYNTPADIDDTFASLTHCIAAVWARHVREALWEINEVFACRRSVPLTDKVALLGGGATEAIHWRAGDDHSQRLSEADFGLDPPTALFDLNGSAIELLSGGMEFVDDIVPANVQLGWGVASMHWNPIALDTEEVLGLVNSAVRYYWLDTNAQALDPDIAFFMGARIPAWNQANDGVVYASVRRFDAAAETGATDRMAWEFGLGTIVPNALHTVGPIPDGTEQDMVLYLRYYTAADQVIQVNCAKFPLGPQYSLGAGPEWFIGFHRFIDGGTMRVRFYINGIRIAERAGLPLAGTPGTSPDLRLMLGSRDAGQLFVGGPMRNVFWYDAASTIDEDLILDLYRKHAGFIDSEAGGG